MTILSLYTPPILEQLYLAAPERVFTTIMAEPTATRIGISGTQEGLTPEQREWAQAYIARCKPAELHHGDCVGADGQIHDITRAVSPGTCIVIHPPDYDGKRAQKSGDKFRAELPYLAMNKKIVGETDLLVGFSRLPHEIQRSGTWHTIRHARKAGKPVIVVWPNGSTEITSRREIKARSRKSSVIVHDYTKKVRNLPSMSVRKHDGTPSDREMAVLRKNKAALDKYFADNPVPPCTDTHCVRCTRKIETYVLCAKCISHVQNYYEMNIIQRTLYMAQKSGAAAEKDERAKSQMLWQIYHTSH